MSVRSQSGRAGILALSMVFSDAALADDDTASGVSSGDVLRGAGTAVSTSAEVLRSYDYDGIAKAADFAKNPISSATIVDSLARGDIPSAVGETVGLIAESRVVRLAGRCADLSTGGPITRGMFTVGCTIAADRVLDETVREPAIDLTGMALDQFQSGEETVSREDSLPRTETGAEGARTESPLTRNPTSAFEDPPVRSPANDDGGFGDAFADTTPDALQPDDEGAASDAWCANMNPEVANMEPADREEFCADFLEECPEPSLEERQAILANSDFYQSWSRWVEENIADTQRILDPILECRERGYIPICGSEADFRHLTSSIEAYENELAMRATEALALHCREQATQ